MQGGVRAENFVDIMIKIHNKIQNIKSCRPRRKSEDKLPFMVRYLTTNGKIDGYGASRPFALRYRRANETFCDAVKIGTRTTNTIIDS